MKIKCRKWNAAFVVSPCCYGRINAIDLPRSRLFKGKIDSQESLLLGHAADITPWDEESAKTGKQCMNLGSGLFHIPK